MVTAEIERQENGDIVIQPEYGNRFLIADESDYFNEDSIFVCQMDTEYEEYASSMEDALLNVLYQIGVYKQ